MSLACLDSKCTLVDFVDFVCFFRHFCTLEVFCRCASTINSFDIHNLDVNFVQRNTMFALLLIGVTCGV